MARNREQKIYIVNYCYIYIYVLNLFHANSHEWCLGLKICSILLGHRSFETLLNTPGLCWDPIAPPRSEGIAGITRLRTGIALMMRGFGTLE